MSKKKKSKTKLSVRVIGVIMLLLMVASPLLAIVSYFMK